MNRRYILLPWLLSLALLAACSEGEPQRQAPDHGHGPAVEQEHGPHGGRLHREHDFSVELAIEEQGQPPRYAAWVSVGGTPVPPAEARVTVRLERLGGRVETHVLRPAEDRLVGPETILEPHSFIVTLEASARGRTARWQYESFEGRTRIPAALAEEAGIRVQAVGPGVVAGLLDSAGRVELLPERRAIVAAPYPGTLRSLAAAPGDRVRRGAVLAQVDSAASLSTYAVRSPIAGTVLARMAERGQQTDGQPLFEIADLGRLAVDLPLHGADALAVAPGMPVRLRRLLDGHAVEARIERLLPATDALSQGLVARVAFDNDDARWRPGMAVEARITTRLDEVGLRLPRTALQRFRDWTVAFVRVGETYEVRPLLLGRSDGEWVEVLEGLETGDEVVVAQSFLVKADIEKSGASHDH